MIDPKAHYRLDTGVGAVSSIYGGDWLDVLDFNRCPVCQVGLGVLTKVLSIAALREAKIKQPLH